MNVTLWLVTLLAQPPGPDPPAPVDPLAWLDEAPLGLWYRWESRPNFPDGVPQHLVDHASILGPAYVLVPARGEGGYRFDPRDVAQVCRKAGIRFGYSYHLGGGRDDESRADRSARVAKQLDDLLGAVPPTAGIWLHGDDGHDRGDWRLDAIVEQIRRDAPNAFAADALEGPEPAEPAALRVFRDQPPAVPPRRPDRWVVLADIATIEPGLLKSPDRIARLLIESVAQGGGLVLEVTPNRSGFLDDLQVRCLDGLGLWLAKHGEALRGTDPGPFLDDLDVGPDTIRGHTVYLFVLNPPAAPTIELTGLRVAPKSAQRLANKEPLEIRTADDKITLAVHPAPAELGGPSVIRLEFDAPPVVD